MSDTITKSLTVIVCTDSETGLRTHAVSLDDLNRVIEYLNKQAVRINDENTRLKAEVERLTGQSRVEQLGTLAPSNLVHYWMEQANIHKAEVERLTKAGDAMQKWIKGFNQPHISAFEWHAAKKGGQP